MKYNSVVKINGREISIMNPTYFIADIASNHDGELERAKNLIWLSKEAGADAVKFQHFKANKIISNVGFNSLGNRVSHQSSWEKSVFEIFKEYECRRDWNLELMETAKKAKIDFFTTPYDMEAVEMFKELPAFKIGSGDITWIEFIEYISTKNKPVLLASGASDIEDIQRAVHAVIKHNPQIVLMQCNTNYTGSLENFKYINLNVLKTFSVMYPNMILGLSDHTPGHSTVLGAISLGARVIEKHFTDDNNRVGPDHPFSMNPQSWKEMVVRSRELELALGNGIKRVEENEKETVIVQRRSLCLNKDKPSGSIITEEDIVELRPAPINSVPPYYKKNIIGEVLLANKNSGEPIFYSDIGCSLC